MLGVLVFVSSHLLIRDLVLKVLEFPESVLLVFPVLGVGLLDDNDLLQILVHLFVFFDVTDVALGHVVSQYSVVESQDFSEVSVDDDGLVIHAKVFLASQFDLDLTEVLADGGLAGVVVVVDVLNVENYKL